MTKVVKTKQAEIDKRVDELADEKQSQLEQTGREGHFGLDIGIAAGRLLQADQSVCEAEKHLPSLLDIAFLMPTQEASLVNKSAGYAFKHLVRILISTKVRELIDRDGKSDEIQRLYLRSQHSHLPEDREKAKRELQRVARPYARHAFDIVVGDVENYDPFNPNGIIGHKLWRE